VDFVAQTNFNAYQKQVMLFATKISAINKQVVVQLSHFAAIVLFKRQRNWFST